MNKKQLLILVASLFLVMLGILLITLLGGRTELQSSKPFAGSINFPFAANHGINYYTSGVFVNYDLGSHETKALTKTFFLPELIDIKWGSNGALFKATDYATTDILGPRIENKFLSKDQPYWWRIDFVSNKISLVGNAKFGAEVVSVTPPDQNNTFYYLQKFSGHNEDSYELYQQKPNQSRALAQLEGVTSIYRANDKHLFASGENKLYKINLEGLDKSVLAEDVGGKVAVSKNNKFIAFNQVGENQDQTLDTASGKLVVLDVEQNKTSSLIEGFVGTFRWQDNQLLFNNKDTVGVYDAGQDNTQRFKIKDTQISSLVDAEPNSNKFLIADNQSRLRYLMEKPQIETINQELPSINSSSVFSGGTTKYKQGFYVAYYPDKNRFNVSITQKPVKKYQNKALEYFRSLELNPLQINIHWYGPED